MDGLEDLSEVELLEALPEKWLELVGVVPLKTVLDIIDNFGGTEISIPQYYRPNVSKKLTEIIGDESLKELITYFSDMIVYVPTGSQLKNLVRHKKIIRLSNEGLPANKIARLVGISVRAVYSNIKKHQSGSGASSTC